MVIKGQSVIINELYCEGWYHSILQVWKTNVGNDIIRQKKAAHISMNSFIA